MHRQCRKIRKNTEKSLNNTGREVPAPRHCFASYERIRTRIVCDMAAYVAAIGQTSDFAWLSLPPATSSQATSSQAGWCKRDSDATLLLPQLWSPHPVISF